MYVDSYGLNYRVNVNGKIIGSFDSNERIPEIFSFHNENDYSFRHKLNSADYLNINGIEYGPYDSVWKPYGLTF